MARQIADALGAAHERGIVHRDLKPANIKLAPNGTVKVLDFGLAKALGAKSSETSVSMVPTMASGSIVGSIVGTPGYMSPEQARGKEVDARTDIWAFGCVLYEMLTARQAFDGETDHGCHGEDRHRAARSRTSAGKHSALGAIPSFQPPEQEPVSASSAYWRHAAVS